MPHLQLQRGTVSLTERLLRKDRQQIAHYLRNAMLSSGNERIDLLLSPQQLDDITAILAQQQTSAGAGQQVLISNLLNRWQTSAGAGQP